MKKSASQFRQVSFNGIEFVSDCHNGSIQWTSYGSDTVGYSPLVKEPLTAVDGGVLDLIVLWVLAFQFNVKDCVNDFLNRVVPIIKSRFQQAQGWYSADCVHNILVDIWTILSGNNPRSATFDPQKGSLSTWIGSRVFGYITEKQRQKKLARKLAGLCLIVDDDTPMSSIGDQGLLGLVFEPSDPDIAPNKWIKMSAKPAGVLESIVATENEVAIERILSEIDPVDREMLEMSFLKGISCQNIRNSLEFRKLRTYKSTNGVRKHILTTVNKLRQKLQPGLPPVVGLKGRHGRVSIMEEIET